jgi:Flp pilus assembly protein CpaB
MEATPSSGRIGGKFSGNPLSGRRGGILVAVAAAVLAGVLLYAFVQHYRKNTPAPAAATTNSVIVASAYIARGTPVSMAEAAGSFHRTSLSSASVLPGAITDPSVIAGEVATENIAPGQELVAADFATGTVSVAQYLTGNQRAMEISDDPQHAMTGYVEPGDRVDLIAAYNGKDFVIESNVLILSTGINGQASSDYVIEVRNDAAAKAIAIVDDGGHLWIVMRPPTDSTTLKTPKAGAATSQQPSQAYTPRGLNSTSSKGSSGSSSSGAIGPKNPGT